MTRRHTLLPTVAVKRFIIFMAIVLACLTANIQPAHASHQHAYRKTFHCYRPFDSLPSFSLGAMQSRDNCRLDYQEVLDAAVRVDCYRNGRRYAASLSGEGGVSSAERYSMSAIDAHIYKRFGAMPLSSSLNEDEGAGRTPSMLTIANGGNDRADVVSSNPPDARDGCYATMFIKTVRDAEGYNGRKGYVSDDEARYSVKIHTLGGGEVHYKGMDGVGYSMCCMLLNQPRDAMCDWQNVSTTTTRDDAVMSASTADTADGPHMERVARYCGLEGPVKGKAGDAEADAADEDDHNEADPLGILGDGDDGNAQLEQRRDERKAAKAVVGFVTKPLHREKAGTWTMEMLMFRGPTAVGKVVADFNVTFAMLRGAKGGGRMVEEKEAVAANTDAATHIEAAPAAHRSAADDASVAAALAVVPSKDGEPLPGTEVPQKKAHKRHHRHGGHKSTADVATAGSDGMKGHHHGRDHHKERHNRKRHRTEDGLAKPEGQRQHAGEEEEDLAAH